jgi:hypothetical protein
MWPCQIVDANSWSDRGAASSFGQEGVDDLDKVASFCVDAIPRRSTSSLAAVRHAARSRKIAIRRVERAIL